MENPTQFKFFIVDDDIFCANIYIKCLNSLGFNNITHYSNGNSCLNNLHQNPDIVFLDYSLEDLTGLEVLKKIKRYNSNIYVVMVSGQENIKIALDAIKYGAYDYIIKNSLVCDKLSNSVNKIIQIKTDKIKVNTSLFNRIIKWCKHYIL